MAAADRLLAFRAGGERFAIPSARVREIARLPRLTRLPHAPAALLGLGNFRGVAVPVVSLAALVDRAAGDADRVILLDEGDTLGLLVDEVQGIVPAKGGPAPLPIDDLLRERLARTAAPRRAIVSAVAPVETGSVAATVALVAFTVAGQAFAMPLRQVERVLPLPAQIAPMPHGDAAAIGSTTLDGALLPLLSLRALLALDPAATVLRPRVLMVRIGAHQVGLVADTVTGVLHVGEDQIDAVPAVLTRGNAEARIQAICRLDQGRRLVSVLAAEHLLHEAITARLGETKEEEAMTRADATEQFLVFRVGEDEFGLPVAAVDEVARLPDRLARLPRAPAFVLGAMNLRGAVVPVIDQSLRFAGTAATGQRRRVVVVRIGELQAGFLVDEVRDVLRVPADALRPAPDLSGEGSRVFERVANLAEADRMVLIVSPRELLDRAERELLQSLAATDAAPAP